MEQNRLKFEELYSEFKKLFPGYNEYFKEAEVDNLVYPDDGAHVSFAFCVMPLIYKFVDEDKKEELIKAFDFFEEMASSPDHLVSEVVAFTILENICTDEYYYPKLKSYFGKNTNDLIPLVASYVCIVKC